MYIYGPYSNEVAEELVDAISNGIVKVDNNRAVFSKGINCDKHLEQYKSDIELNVKKIDKVLKFFGDYFTLVSGTVCHGPFYCQFKEACIWTGRRSCSK